MFTSLNSKLVAIMLILSLSLVTVLVLLYRHTEKALYADFERQTAELSEAIRIGVQELSRKGAYNDRSLKAALARLNIKGVTEISVISTSNRVLASTDPEEVGKWLTRSRRELIVRAELGQPVTSEEKFFDVVIPVASEGVTLGYIHLRMSTEAFSVFMRTSAIRRIAAALFIFVLGTGLAWVLARWYTKPIEEMVRAARRVAGGDLHCELPAGRRDEIGQLAQSFNYMIGKLREDRDLREKLRKAEHLAGIGQFSRSIAHEIKNPLNFVSLGIDHMQEAYRPDTSRDDGRFDSLLENMKKEIQRVSRFAESFLEFGKSLELNRVDTDMDGLIGTVLDLVAVKAAKEGVEIVRESEGPPPVLRVDPDFIRTCLYNILLNAFQAMPGGGRLVVRTRSQPGWFVVEIADSGQGAPPEVVAHAFDPFFTTKTGGIGLGLAFTKRVVEEHDGRVRFESQPGQGSTVQMLFPYASEEVA
jgi:signal transduction histidine kinase